jgi:hypothetical protein
MISTFREEDNTSKRSQILKTRVIRYNTAHSNEAVSLNDNIYVMKKGSTIPSIFPAAAWSGRSYNYYGILRLDLHLIRFRCFSCAVLKACQCKIKVFGRKLEGKIKEAAVVIYDLSCASI